MPSLLFVPPFPSHPDNSAQKDNKWFIIPSNQESLFALGSAFDPRWTFEYKEVQTPI